MEAEALKKILKEKGPLVGKELYLASGAPVFELWRLSYLEFLVKKVGTRYLRFDKNVDDYARLSPAIEREFLTYSVVGLEEQEDSLKEMAKALENGIKEISERKMRLAERVVKEVSEGHDLKSMCFVLGGDIPLGMAHSDPRPERSTGKMVAGSDLDIVVVVRDRYPEDNLKELDEAMYAVKYSLLRRPVQKEELDYLVKSFSKVKEQAKFDSFEDMIACKILHEGKLLLGSNDLYQDIVELLRLNDIPPKLSALEKEAAKKRAGAEEYLLKKGEIGQEEYMKLFTTTEEFGEIF
ncbi:MAG: hypothetical protein V3T58_02100 [Candidatus Hydrothermarchaeales archaeon]